MRTVTAAQIQRLDSLSIRGGVASLALMENAGTAVTREILKDTRKIPHPQVVIFCGTGNNGGDGFVVARQLQLAKVAVTTFLVGRVRELKSDAAKNYQLLKKIRVRIVRISSANSVTRKALAHADLVVDALFGVGLNRALQPPWRTLIEQINASGKPVLAVDVPSGLDATTGKIWGAVIQARKTVTFTYAKSGFAQAAGSRHVGQVVVAQIGIPERFKKILKTR